MILKDITELEYNIIYSLGNNCLTSTELNRMNLKLMSGPLDWIYAPNTWGVMELLQANFNGFMDFNQLEVTGINEDSGCYLVLDKKFHLVSVHDFTVDSNTATELKEWPSVREKLMRRAERMQLHMKTFPRLLFIRTDTTLKEAVELKKTLDQKVGHDYRLLIINHVLGVQKVNDLRCPLHKVCILQIPQVTDMFTDNQHVWTEILSQLSPPQLPSSVLR